MGIISWIIAGLFGKLIMPDDDPGGIIVTILLGIVGPAWAASSLPSLEGPGLPALTCGRY